MIKIYNKFNISKEYLSNFHKNVNKYKIISKQTYRNSTDKILSNLKCN